VGRGRKASLLLGPALPVLVALLSGCNSALWHGIPSAFQEAPGASAWAYAPCAGAGAGDADGELLLRFAPAFVVEQGAADWNRIGTPFVRRRACAEWVRVDTAAPALYGQLRRERLGELPILQLVYRVHFDQLAFSWKYLFSLHRNAGLLVLVTLEERSLAPLFVTSVHTCGCWAAVTPTDQVPRAALPADWPAERLELAGENLPAVLAWPPGGRPVLGLRTRTHRVHALAAAAAPEGVPARALPLRPLDELHRLEVEGRPGETASLYYEGGYLEGYVRGAWPPLEGLTLGLLTLDPRLGMDRDFGPPEETGARFFTALAPWRREETRLDRFGPYLARLGFDLAALAAREP
jgi:hypothetical protein